MFPEHERKVRISVEVMDKFFTRDHAGNRLRVEWGEPDAEGFYTPTIHVDYTDNPLRDRLAEVGRLVQVYTDDVGNNEGVLFDDHDSLPAIAALTGVSLLLNTKPWSPIR